MANRRQRAFAGVGIALVALSGCGAGSVAVEARDGVPEAPAAAPSATATPKAAAEEPDCVPPPLPSVIPDFGFGPGEGPTYEQIRDNEDVDHALKPAHDFEHADGYATVRYLGGRKGEIDWKGEPPPEIAAMAGTSPTCVTIVLVQVPYSRAEVNAAGTRVRDAAVLGRVPMPTVTGPNRTFTALRVGLAELPDGGEAETLRQRLAGIAQMPVTLECTGPITDLMTSSTPPPNRCGRRVS